MASFGASAANWHEKPLASSDSGLRIAHRPAHRPSQNASTPTPNGLTTPNPVMAIGVATGPVYWRHRPSADRSGATACPSSASRAPWTTEDTACEDDKPWHPPPISADAPPCRYGLLCLPAPQSRVLT